MFTHINVDKDKAAILNKFEKSLIMLDDPSELMLFNVIDFLGCYTSALFKTNYSASDCCNTVETLENLFMVPRSNDYINIVSSRQLREIFDADGNFFYDFKVMPKGMTFHTFVVVKYESDWFLMQSFFGIYGLSVKEDKDIPFYLSEFIESATAKRFNHLFGTSFPESETATASSDINMKLSYHELNELPRERLVELIEDFIAANTHV